MPVQGENQEKKCIGILTLRQAQCDKMVRKTS